MSADTIEHLRSLVGAANVLTQDAAMAPYCTDWRGRYTGTALCVVRPGSTEEVAAVVGLCAHARLAIVPQGGNTGLCGGATPRSEAAQSASEVLLSLTRMNRICEIDSANNTLTAEAGCVLAAVQEAAAAAGRLFPLALAAEGSATIGGNLATNAGGVQVLRYGTARDLCLGLEVVLPDGRVWNGLRGLRKDNTGYDLKHLFIGAEGTLGIITAAVLKLFPPVRVTASAWAAVRDPAAAVALLACLRDVAGERVSAFEIVGRPALDLVLRHIPNARDPLADSHAWQVLIELSDTQAESDLDGVLQRVLEAAITNGDVLDVALAMSGTQARAFWALRENVAEGQKIEGLAIKHDIAVPVSRIAEFVARADNALERAFPGVRIVCFGHIGDGNLHYNQSCSAGFDNEALLAATPAVNRIVHDLVHEVGGSISAEHGLGQLKREEILRYKSPVEMKMMRAIKHAIDPAGRMNPGKLL